jgi:hypothetical protein
VYVGYDDNPQQRAPRDSSTRTFDTMAA